MNCKNVAGANGQQYVRGDQDMVLYRRSCKHSYLEYLVLTGSLESTRKTGGDGSGENRTRVSA